MAIGINSPDAPASAPAQQKYTVYAGGTSVRITWENGDLPTVRQLLEKAQIVLGPGQRAAIDGHVVPDSELDSRTVAPGATAAAVGNKSAGR